MTIESVIVSLSAGRLRSHNLNASVLLADDLVNETDIENVIDVCQAQNENDDRQIIHLLPLDYRVDFQNGIADPLGLTGKELGFNAHFVDADISALRNLDLLLQRCHLDSETYVVSPYASGLACLDDDEMDLGCAVIDMGGSTTSISIFSNEQFMHVDALAIGGHHVTLDIARGLSIKLQDAERIKNLYGSVISAPSDDDNVISVETIGDFESPPLQVPISTLTRIIKPRIEETLELIHERLLVSGFANQIGKRIILTGGASQLTGVSEMARRIFGCSVRIGRPLGISGMPTNARGPAFSTVAGLLIYPQVARIEGFDVSQWSSRSQGGFDYFNRLKRWMKGSL